MPELKVILKGADERDLTKLAEYQAMRAPVKQRLDKARADLAKLRRSAAAARPLGEVTAAELAAAWPAMTVDERRPVIVAFTAELAVVYQCASWSERVAERSRRALRRAPTHTPQPCPAGRASPPPSRSTSSSTMPRRRSRTSPLASRPPVAPSER